MTKRFTEIEKWKDLWFRKLPPHYKLIWFYLLDNCDDAGLFEMDFEMVRFFTGIKEIDEGDFLKSFEGRILHIKDDTYIIKKFIEYQYGNLRLYCAPHLKVLRCLERVGLVTFDRRIEKTGGQERSIYENVNADAYGRVLGRALGTVPSRVHGTVRDKDKDKDKDKCIKKRGGVGEKNKSKNLTQLPEEIKDLVEHWNKYAPITHSLDSKFLLKLGPKLKEKNFSVDDLKKAIENYAEILNLPPGTSTWTYSKWDILDFVSREGSERFHPDRYLKSKFLLDDRTLTNQNNIQFKNAAWYEREYKISQSTIGELEHKSGKDKQRYFELLKDHCEWLEKKKGLQ